MEIRRDGLGQRPDAEWGAPDRPGHRNLREVEEICLDPICGISKHAQRS
jgi:hypothetical protein